MKHIVSISFGPSHSNTDKVLEFNGERFRLSQYGVNFDLSLLETLVKQFDNECDVISVSGLPMPIPYGNKFLEHSVLKKIRRLVKYSMLVDGSNFRNTYIPWATQKFCRTNGHLIKKQNIGFLCAAFNRSILSVVEDYTDRTVLADPFFMLKIPKVLYSGSELDKFVGLMAPVLRHAPVSEPKVRHLSSDLIDRYRGFQELDRCNVLIANAIMFDRFDYQNLKGKTIILDRMEPHLQKRLHAAGVDNVVTFLPKFLNEPNANFSLIEAVFQLFKDDHTPIDGDDVIDWIENLKLDANLYSLNTHVPTGKTKFAFIIHPLTNKDFFRHPLARPLKPFQKNLASSVEKMASNFGGIYYGKIKGVKSEATGDEIEGDIYSVFETPKMLLSSDPEKIYKKLVRICKMASKNGADIIGLGAYTKIVGDAGVSVAKRSPIPVTTGNSLSSASTIWAAKFAVDKMGFVKKDKKGIYQGTVMVVGATGSIGAVSAKLLAQSWSKVVLIAPRPHKLLELKEEVLEVAPNVEIEIATNPDKYAASSDLIVTTTSSQGKKVLDIMTVKSGCVICDVSRPFDISEKDALQRPDVLIIASGEVELPGETKLTCDIGLEGNVVYACLAETALLALEGKFESFTLSRNINYEKVREIDRLARKHGVRLSAIMGHAGEVTEKEIELCRQHVLSKN